MISIKLLLATDVSQQGTAKDAKGKPAKSAKMDAGIKTSRVLLSGFGLFAPFAVFPLASFAVPY